jgi:hypothetical protein
VEVGALEDALGDPERDPVDEITLPQLQRGRRGFGETREVGEVAPEGLPALRASRWALGERRRHSAALRAASRSTPALTAAQEPRATSRSRTSRL